MIGIWVRIRVRKGRWLGLGSGYGDLMPIDFGNKLILKDYCTKAQVDLGIGLELG